MECRIATLEDLEQIAQLFDAYRVFYEQASDIKAAEAFLAERIAHKESVIIIAEKEGKLIGFTQLYPTFSSVSMQRFYILNDLYVVPEERKNGVGKALLLEAQALVKQKGWKGLALETAPDNPAQFLYEKLDWERDSEFYHYFWRNK
ncbi:GNAT family N-acetyltransferase [Limibacter armeniacum]|uniref:GNAT family N-acetyltransferase n=1 Tax=Limibacter armeniacum TaxID=466084 RepID=UPI002FE51AB0